MGVTTCSGCGGTISDFAAVCPQCGQPVEAADRTVEEPDSEPREPPEAVPAERPFFPVSPGKFAAMSVCTFGLYELFWAYHNWKRIRDRAGDSLSPFWRAFFAPLWAFSLFGRVKDEAVARGVGVGWSSGVAAGAYLALSISWRLPDPWWLVSLLTFLAVLPVVATLQEVNRQAPAAEDLNESFSGVNFVGLVLGGMWVLLAVWGTFLPE